MNSNVARARQRIQTARLPAGRVGQRPNPGKLKPGRPLPGGKTAGLDPRGRKGAGKLPGALGRLIPAYRPLPWVELGPWRRTRGTLPALLAGIGDLAWAQNFPFWGVSGFDGALVPGLGGGGYLCDPGEGPGGAPIFQGDGFSFPCPPSIDPGYPCVWLPNSSDAPGGDGLALCIDPNSVEGGEVGDDVDDPDVLVSAASSVWQTTRYLRVANNTGAKIKVYVKYHAPTDNDDWAWVPDSSGDAAVAYELDAGEVVDLADNNWRINADVVRIWAESDSKKWNHFKDRDLWLVPETDPADKDNHGYVAQEIETFIFTIR